MRESKSLQSLEMPLETSRGKTAPAGLFPPRLSGRAGFEGFQYSQFEPGWDSAGVTWMAEEVWLSCGFKLWVNLAVWESPPARALLGEDNSCTAVFCLLQLLRCLCVAVQCGPGLWVSGRHVCGELFHCLVLAPEKTASCPGKKLKVSLVTLHPGVPGIWQVSVSLG